jgi:prepilin-type N-terminal cleavage/methylation domain-containing protein
MLHARSRRGMTLIEIVAAVAIAGFVIVTGAALLDQLNDAGARIAGDATTTARAGNGRRLFRELLAHAEASVDTNDRFRADSASVAYLTRCPNAFGWTEPCHVQLAMDYRADSTEVVAVFGDGREITLRVQAKRAEFRFLNLAHVDSVWASVWTTSATLPDAIAVVSGTDTVVFPVGAAR